MVSKRNKTVLMCFTAGQASRVIEMTHLVDEGANYPTRDRTIAASQLRATINPSWHARLAERGAWVAWGPSLWKWI